MRHLVGLLQVCLITATLRMTSGASRRNQSSDKDTLQSAAILSVIKKVFTDETNLGPVKSIYQPQFQQNVTRISNVKPQQRRLVTDQQQLNLLTRSQTVNFKNISNVARTRDWNTHTYHTTYSRPSVDQTFLPQTTFQNKEESKAPFGLTRSEKDISNNKIHCPEPCHCSRSLANTITIVDCSNKGLLSIPLLPSTVEIVYLQNNTIENISCHSFENLTVLTEIDLSHNTISEFAGCSFSSLVSLNYLKLSNCGLKNLPYGILDYLSNLLALDLSVNHIHHIDGQIFRNMTRLERLNLYQNDLDTIKNSTFHGLRSLRFLSLQKNRLQYTPSTFEPLAFRGLLNLQVLHLQGNQNNLSEAFVYPDQALSLLPWLRELRLDGHPRPLGPGFASLTNLSILDFSTDHQHDLESFCLLGRDLPPDFFAHLGTRQPLTLNMSSCSIDIIPPDLFLAVPTIHTLDLSDNHYLEFESFRIGSKGLEKSNLSVLNLSHIVKSGRMASVKNTTFQYLKHTSLKVLMLDDCQLFKINPQAIMDLPRTIEIISVQNNRIQYGHFLLALPLLYNLKIIKLSYQLHYSAIPYSDTEIYALHNSDSNTAIDVKFPKDKNRPSKTIHALDPFPRNIRSEHHESKNLTVEVNGDPTKTFCHDLESSFPPENFTFGSSIAPLPTKLEFIYASDINTKYSVPKIDVFNNNVLKYFDYSKNEAKCFGGPLTGVPMLEHLDLSYNWCLRVSPFMFSDMPSLTTLLLHHNVLGQSLHDDTEGVTLSTLLKLKTLDLSHNSLKQISPEAFTQNTQLQNLNLSNNDLSSFNSSLATLHKLNNLDLSANSFVSFSDETCRQLVDMKTRNANFTVRIKNNRFLCDCGNLRLLRMLLVHRQVFYDFEYFQCYLSNGSVVSYNELKNFIPYLEKTCAAEITFIIVLVIFILFSALLVISSLYYYKRWQWTYLYYLGKSRLHIGSTFITYKPVAHTFITYDQEERTCRSFIRELVLPALRHLDMSHILGETDFSGGPLASSIAGAVASTQKTLIFLSRHIFKDFHRQLELNLAIMHELYMRRRIVVPVLLLNCGHELASRPANGVPFYQQELSLPSQGREDGEAESEVESIATEETGETFHDDSGQPCSHRDTPIDLIDSFPPEIAAYLRGQAHRCLVYNGDSDHQFWSSLRDALFDEC